VRRRGAALIATGVLLLTACGRSSPADRTLGATQSHLDDIRSGTLSLLLLASSLDAPDGTGAGFQVEGDFAVGEKKGSLPVADLQSTRIIGSERRTSRFVSTGTQAYVEIDGVRTDLSDSELAGLRVRDGSSSDAGLEGLTLSRWLEDAEVAPGPEVDGVATEQVTGKADAIAILNDVIGLADQFGAQGGVKRLEGDAADRVRRAVASAQAEVVTGKDDHLLRQAHATVDLAVTDPKVRDALGDLAGARLVLDLKVTNLNQPVAVAAP
jgi:hypothetical protein